MDAARRTVDRADAVRAVPQAASRTTQEVLQRSLRGRASPSAGDPEGGQRGCGGEGRDQTHDMRALCRVCGVDMWPCDPRKLYCSKTCIAEDRRRTERQARVEELAKRRCLTCGGPLPLTATRRRRYCSKACEPPNRYAGERTCATCGAVFRATNKGQRCCSVSCGQKMRQARAHLKNR